MGVGYVWLFVCVNWICWWCEGNLLDKLPDHNFVPNVAVRIWIEQQ
jgi:hypothetical protein